MRKSLLSSFVGTFLAISLATGATLVGPAVAASAAEPDTIQVALNEARVGSGLQPLIRNSSLDAVAGRWAEQMASMNQMMHNPNFTTQIPSGWVRAGENVAYGQPNGAAVHAAWMASDGHKRNILGDFTDVGIAFFVAAGSTWSVEVFANYPGHVYSSPGSKSFVRAMYQDVLSRAAGDSEVAGWVKTLSLGYTPVQVASGFVNSDEYRLRRINSAYSSILDRSADNGGVKTWLTEMRANRIGPDDVEKTFLASDEFFLRSGGTNEEFVKALYKRLLLREAGASEVAEWAGIIRDKGRFAVVDAFWRCLETAQQRVASMYRDYLGRTPDPKGLTDWAWIAIGQGDSAVRWSLVGSAEYWARASARFPE